VQAQQITRGHRPRILGREGQWTSQAERGSEDRCPQA
jgi:hypothetical protein